MWNGFRWRQHTSKSNQSFHQNVFASMWHQPHNYSRLSMKLESFFGEEKSSKSFLMSMHERSLPCKCQLNSCFEWRFFGIGNRNIVKIHIFHHWKHTNWFLTSLTKLMIYTLKLALKTVVRLRWVLRPDAWFKQRKVLNIFSLIHTLIICEKWKEKQKKYRYSNDYNL